jgi:hypothetical protein
VEEPYLCKVLISVGYQAIHHGVVVRTDPADVEYKTGASRTSCRTRRSGEGSSAAGLEVVKDPGVDGKRVLVTRTVKKGGQVLRTDTFTSYYTPKSATVRVGTKIKGSKTATPTVSPKKP